MADAFSVAFIEVLPDTTKFGAALRAQLAGISSTATVAVRGASQGAAAATVTATAAIASRWKATGAAIAASGRSISAVGMNITRGITVPVIAAGYAIFSTSKQFETSMHRIVGLVGISQKQVDIWGRQIIDLAPKVKRPVTELADALYFVTSSGLDTSHAMDVLTVSAKAATAGLGDTAVIADAVTSAMNAYGAEVLPAAKATDILVAAVRYGKIEASQLAPVLGRIIPTASALNISFSDMAAVLAVMSRTGLDAAEGATSLGAIMSTLLKPSAGAVKTLKEHNLTARGLRDMLAKPGGLVAVMRLLSKEYENNDEDLARIVPNVRAFRGVMNVLAQDGKSVDEVLNGVRNSSGSLDKAFAAAADTSQARYDASLAKIQGSLIKLGADVMPLISDGLDRLADRISSVTDWWSKLSPATRSAALNFILIAAVSGPVISIVGRIVTTVGLLVKGVGLLIGILPKLGAAFTAATGPVGLVIIAIAALVAGFIYAYKHSETFRRITDQVWAAVKQAISAAITWVVNVGWPALQRFFMLVADVAMWLWRNVIMPAWHGIQVAIDAAVRGAQLYLRVLQTEFNVVGTVVMWLWRHIFSPAFEGIKLIINIFVRFVSIAFGLVEIAVKILSAVITYLWRTVFQPIFTLIVGIIRWWWSQSVANFNRVATVVRWFWVNVVQPVFSAIGSFIRSTWNSVIKPTLNALGNFIKTYVAPAFKVGVDAIRTAWNAVKEAAKAPVRFVVETVINKGIIDSYNKLAGFFHVHTVSHVPLPRGFAAGGIFTEPTAIVGEGNTSRPEYVIPTDPAHRSRALALYASLGTELMARGGIIGDALGSLIPFNPLNIAKSFDGARKMLKRISGSPWGNLVAHMPEMLIDGAVNFFKGQLKKLGNVFGGGGGGGAGVSRWTNVAIQALQYTGNPLSWLPSLMRRMQRESGGNQYAINRWDINAMRGDPSRGLMQTIGATFNAYARELRGRGIYDPFANIVAAIRYTVTRYGSGPAGWDRAGGYDNGGLLMPGTTLAYNGTGKPERVIPNDGTLTKEDLIDAFVTALRMVGLDGPLVEVKPSLNANELNHVVDIRVDRKIARSAYDVRTGRR